MHGPTGSRGCEPGSALLLRDNAPMTSAAPRRRGPRPGQAPGTREAIVAAARAEFGDRGFSGATMRSIAARAGVDPALIHHYFGTKQGLFSEVLLIGMGPARQALPRMLAGPRDEAGRRIVRTFLELYEDPSVRDPMIALMRSAMTSPEAAALAASLIGEEMLPRVATLAVGPDPQRQVALVMTHLLGTMLGRHVIGLPALQGPVEALVDELAPVVQRYLDGS